MKFQRFSLLLALSFVVFGSKGIAQSPAHVAGQLLVSLSPGASPQILTRRIQEELSIEVKPVKKVSNLLNIWLLETKTGQKNEALAWLRRRPEARMAQFNYLLDDRGGLLPNDPLFNQQWHFINTGANGGLPDADLDAELAWDITTGGLSAAGDTIVVAVIDGGIDQNHNDLAPNLWKNWAEIPNDGLDNDNNGYTDDFRGWNVYAENDNIAGLAAGHGTPVSAIIGAKGNNGTGVTGVNWNVKIMFVAGGGAVANVLEAYDYVLQARRRYNATNGAAGAFVVALNCSFGINYGQPADNPLWCAAIDSLGAAGILNVAATANIAVNVDDVGDMPTACPSDYLLAVTNITKTDQKAANAAWGLMHIDLGAYGQEVYTASANNLYGSHSGTSFASPQVAGAVGLLYASPCPNLIALAKSDPAAAALWAKNLILNGTTPNTYLQGITLTGGRLNLHTMLQYFAEQCDPCPPPFALITKEITTQSAVLKWSEIADFQTVNLRWRALGASTWTQLNGVKNSYLLENLTACTEYEFSLMADCAQGEISDWSASLVFKTDGCCEPPAAVWITDIGSKTAAVHWNDVTAAVNGYRLRVRPAGGNWEVYQVTSPGFTLHDLLPCTDYEAQVQTLCDTGATAFSNTLFFKTAGCGSCTDAAYCKAKSGDAEGEWIASVAIGNWAYTSGEAGDGYQDFTGTATPPTLMRKSIVNVTVTPGFNDLAYKEWFRIFVDFNLDGDFDDSTELAFNPLWASDAPVSGQITVPDIQSFGLTRMRVMMKYKGASLPPGSCDNFDFGQVEDYCVELVDAVSTGSPEKNAGRLRIYPQPARDEVWLELPDGSEGEWNISAWDVVGKSVFSDIAPAQGRLLHLNTNNCLPGVYVIQAEQMGKTLNGLLILK